MERKTIWIINQYASHLETRHWELAQSFSDQNYNVVVITSSFHHGLRKYLFDEPIVFRNRAEHVHYVYLHSGPSYQDNGIKRIINMIDFCRLFHRFRKVMAAKLGKPSYIIASSAPPFVWESGRSAAKLFHAKFIAEFRDIWPQSLVDVQGVSPKHPLVRLLSVIEKRTYKHSDAIVATMPYAWKHVIKVADVPREKIHWMPNGINMDQVDKWLHSDSIIPAALNDYLENHWCCVYVGSIVKSECLDHILKSFALVDDMSIYMAIIGNGHEKERIMALANKMGLKNVKFFPAIDKQLIPKVLSKARVCIAAHEDLPIYRYGLSMNKLNDYLASGTPTIFACNAHSVVDDAGHFVISINDERALAETIIKIRDLSDEEIKALQDSAVQVMRESYDYPAIGKKYIQMLEQL